MSNEKTGLGKWPSVLHKLINDERGDEWNNVIKRVKSFPHEASIVGAHHLMTPLQAACLRYPPYEVVKVLLEAAPGTVLLQNREGETTLHLATEGSSEDVQILLLKSYPDAVMKQDKYGDTPFHRACTIGSMSEILEYFIMANPDVLNVPNNDGMTPFFMISRGYEMAKSLSDVSEDGEYWDDWEKAMLLLRASYFRSPRVPKGETFCELIAAASSKCPMGLLKTCIRFFPSQLLSQDKEGLTPLAIATRVEFFEEPLQVSCDGDDEMESDSRIQILLRAEPKAAMVPDESGRYPLFHAIENHLPWEKGLKELLLASSQLLNTCDPKTKLYPFMLAASAKKASLETIYQLFVSFPALSHLAIPEGERSNTKKNAHSLDSNDVIIPTAKKLRHIL